MAKKKAEYEREPWKELDVVRGSNGGGSCSSLDTKGAEGGGKVGRSGGVKFHRAAWKLNILNHSLMPVNPFPYL